MKIPISGPDEEKGVIYSAGEETEEKPSRGEPTEAVRGEDIPIDDAAELARQLKEKTQEAESQYHRLLRFQADFDNFKKRVEKEKAEYVKYANQELIEKLLTVVDDLERALASASDDAAGEPLLEGIKLIESKLKDILDKAGLQEVQALGQQFDPHYHEAVMTAPAREGEDNTVTQELQKGYLLSGKVIRPARVVVAVKGSNED